MPTTISCFISPHGFGHATRTISVLQHLYRLLPGLRVQLLTTVPERLFEELPGTYEYHPVEVDIGLVQHDALAPDLTATIARLKSFLPHPRSLVDSCRSICRDSELIYCDISPLGLEIARQLLIPGLLLENFTWDWIYRRHPGTGLLEPFAEDLKSRYRKADYHLQAEPVCEPIACDLRCSPIARSATLEPAAVRRQLGNHGRKVVVITMGGVPQELPFLERLTEYGDYLFVLTGQRGSLERRHNLVLVPYFDSWSHPDLTAGADLVVCKAGYSTIAECARGGTRVCCISRPDFAESAVLENYVTGSLGGSVLERDSFLGGSWLARLPTLTTAPKPPPAPEGAAQAARFVAQVLNRTGQCPRPGSGPPPA